MLQSYTLYALNLPAPPDFTVPLPPAGTPPPPDAPGAKPKAAAAPLWEAGRHPVVYSYQQPHGGLKAPAVRASNVWRLEGAGCTVASWVGKEVFFFLFFLFFSLLDRTQRYIWIDLTAGPVSYGPQTSGEGIMTEFSLPHLNRIVPDSSEPAKNKPAASAPAQQQQQQQQHHLQHSQMIPRHEFMAELVATVRQAARHVFTPTVDRFPVRYTKYLSINIIMIHDDATLVQEHELDAEKEKQQSQERLKKMEAPGFDEERAKHEEEQQQNQERQSKDPKERQKEENRRSVREHWAGVRSELKSMAFQGQQIDVNVFHMNFFDCELCVAAYTHSLKSHTSNILTDGLRTQVHQYLDSSEAHDWLEHFRQELLGTARGSFVFSVSRWMSWRLIVARRTSRWLEPRRPPQSTSASSRASCSICRPQTSSCSTDFTRPSRFRTW